MKLHESGEDYLEAILILQQKKGMVRSTHLADYMNYTKPSICHAVSVLQDGGFITKDMDGYLHLTEEGRKVAEKIYERHQVLSKMLTDIGVSKDVAEQDACRMEHGISEESFQKLKQKLDSQ